MQNMLPLDPEVVMVMAEVAVGLGLAVVMVMAEVAVGLGLAEAVTVEAATRAE